MSEDDITILKVPKGRLYYYQGNFYYPFMAPGIAPGLIKRAIREFSKSNVELISKDRNDPKYQTLLEIFDEQLQHSLCPV